jgi:hypothetical protein
MFTHTTDHPCPSKGGELPTGKVVASMFGQNSPPLEGVGGG